MTTICPDQFPESARRTVKKIATQAPAPTSLPRIVAMWVQMGKTWSRMFDLLAQDSDTDCSIIFTGTAPYLEVRISVAMDIKLLWICNLARASGMMGHDCQTWTLHGMETNYWEKFHPILLQLQTRWAYWFMGFFFTTLSYRLGYIGRETTGSYYSCRPVGSFVSCVIFTPHNPI